MEVNDMSNMEKVFEMIDKDPDIKSKLEEEIKHLTESKGGSTKEVISEAVKNITGIDISCEELTPDGLDNVAGGGFYENLSQNPIEGFMQSFDLWRNLKANDVKMFEAYEANWNMTHPKNQGS